jgi:diguanylate cyclase (GGDEF)-like protein
MAMLKQRVPLVLAGVAIAALFLPVIRGHANLWLLHLVPAQIFGFYRGARGALLLVAASWVLAIFTALSGPFHGTGPLVIISIFSLINGFLFEKLHKRSFIDELTGLYNRRGFIFYLDQHLAQAERLRIPLSVAIVDIDGFKSINDSFGHLYGDQVLCQVARLIKETCRAADVSARWGGDEFALALLDTSAAGALVLAERLRMHVEKKASLPITISVGVSTFPTHAGGKEELLANADRALLLAKKDRNMVVLEPDPSHLVPQY